MEAQYTFSVTNSAFSDNQGYDSHSGFQLADFFGHGQFSGNRTSPAVCSNTTIAEECNELHLGSFSIISPELIPCCLLALYLGITLSRATLKIKTNCNVTYAITFFLVGCMMTFAMFTDTLLPLNVPQTDPFFLFCAIMDVGLTSTIAFTFMINGLVDAGVLSQSKKSTYYIMGAGTALIFFGWYRVFFGGWRVGYIFMYLGIIAICCGTWLVIEVYLLLLSKNNTGLKYFFMAGLSGGFGFMSMFNRKLMIFLCEEFTCYWGPALIWFMMTDVAIYYIFLFYKARHGLNDNSGPFQGLYEKLRNAF